MSKDLESDISYLLKKLNLPFKESDFKEIGERYKKKEHFFTALIKTKSGEKAFLKVRLQKSRETIKDFKKEIVFYQIFKKRFQNKKRKILFPEIISWGKYKNLLWYLKKYQEGTLGGLMGKDFGFKSKFLKSASPNNLAEGIKDYQSIPSRLTKKLSLYSQGSWWYWQDFNFYQKTFLKKFLYSDLNQNFFKEDDLGLIKKIIKNNKKLLDKEANFLCHGDFYPNNVLLTPSKKILILDWEKSTLNNPSLDVAFIYLNAWRDKNWQKIFLKSYLRDKRDKNKFKKLFQISLISLSIRFSGHCWRYLEEKYFKKQIIKKEIKKRAFLVLKKHLKVLRTSIYKLNEIL